MFRFLLVLSLLALAGAACASDDNSAGQAMTAGIEQFREGNYPLAREHFERSLALGADTPALRYNLGVVCYKTGDYAAARNHFRRY